MINVVIVGTGALALQCSQWIDHINRKKPIIKNIGFLKTIYDNSSLVYENIIGELNTYVSNGDERFVVALKNPSSKKAVTDLLATQSVKYINIIHPSASIAHSAKIGLGNIIFPNATISANAIVANHVTILFSGMGHDAIAEDYVTIESSCDITGGVHLCQGCQICASSIIVPYKTVGNWSTVSPGSVVIKDIGNNLTVQGNPARKLKN